MTINISEKVRAILHDIAQNIPDTEPLDYRREFHKRATVVLTKQYPEGCRVALKLDGSVLCKITVDDTDHNLKLHGVVNENFLIF